MVNTTHNVEHMRILISNIFSKSGQVHDIFGLSFGEADSA